ncbi:MAG: regulatory signaling modulator protein AmpE [Gammaproteobacteria bacterium]|nr:regulatory signaling modulator protein AmpE [Gammaproteobacteria bacterium]
MSELLLAILLAVALDRYLPDRHGFKPFAWYRDWAESIEQRFNGGSRVHGIGAVLLAILPILAAVVLARYVLSQMGAVLGFLFDVLILYLCLDIFRLGNDARGVAEALDANDYREAEVHYKRLSGKTVPDLSEAGIAQATVESVLKHGNSLVISPLFWFLVFGPAGAVAQRLAHILDKLWGHRYERFVEFGWAAARLDDLLQWIPARITALSYAIMGSFEDALHCWRRRMGIWSDINSGPLLASGFGAMHMQNCEALSEVDEYEERIVNLSVVPNSSHIRGVVALVWRVLLFWLAIGLLMTGAHLVGLFTR